MSTQNSAFGTVFAMSSKLSGVFKHRTSLEIIAKLKRGKLRVYSEKAGETVSHEGLILELRVSNPTDSTVFLRGVYAERESGLAQLARFRDTGLRIDPGAEDRRLRLDARVFDRFIDAIYLTDDADHRWHVPKDQVARMHELYVLESAGPKPGKPKSVFD